MEHTTCSARSSRARSVWLRVLLTLGLLFGMGNAAAQCALTGTVGAPFSRSFSVTGGSPPYTWSISAGALPAGLTLTSSGATALISGTPTAGGAYAFTLRVAHSGGSGTLACTLVVGPPTIVVSPATLPAGAWGVAYSQSVTASGGTAPYTFAVTAGALPPGTTLASNGTLSGTPTAAGTFNFTIRATDSSTGTGPYSGSRAYTLAVAAPTISLAPASVPAATVGIAYDQSISASGGSAPYSYAVTSGALPAGVSLSAAGNLAGTPTAGGSFNFAITATDGNGFTGTRAYTLDVGAPAMSLAPATLPNAVAGLAYTQTLAASGGTAPYNYTLGAGALPAGMSLASSGTLSGTTTTAGTFNFTVVATDSSTGTGPYTASRAYTLVVDAPTIAITPATLPAGTAGTAYSQALDASGGVAPYGYALVGGALPSGMTLSSAGVLSGTPTVAGTFNFSVRATDANGFTGDQAYTLAIAAPTIALTPTTLPAGTAGTAYTQALDASGGVAPYGYTLAGGALPSGMTLSSAGLLSGTPTVAGSFNFSVRATDANGFTGDQAYTLTIAAPSIALTPTTLPAGTAGNAYSQALAASGGVGPYGYALVGGALPSGMTLSSAGLLSGTPTVAGNFSFSVRATDANGFAGDQAYTLAIAAPSIALMPATLPAGTAGAAYSQALAASGGVGPYAYAVSAGALPAGLALSPAGVLAGTPTAVGSFNFTVRATDANGFSGQQSYTLSIVALVPVATNDSARTTAARAVTVDVTANDTGGPFTAASVLSVSPADAGTATIAQSGSAWLLTFVPAANFSGTATVRYTVSNAYATSAAATLEIVVEARPDPSRDPDVLGLLSAQAESTRGFARAQILNVQQRLETLHGGANGNGWDNRLSPTGATRCDRAAGTCPTMQDTDADAETAAGAAAQPTAAPVGLWAAGAFGSGERDFHFGRSALEFETRGISVGADYRLSNAFVLGAALGYGRDRTNVGVRDTRVDGDAWATLAYASWSPSAATFVDAVFGYQRLSFDTRRTVAANGALVAGSRDGAQWFGSVATGYESRHGGMVIAPYARVDVAKAELDGYAEQGDPVHALRYGQQDVDTGTASLGLRLERAFQQGWGLFTPLLRIEHQRDFHGQGGATLQYVDLPTGPFYRSFGDTFDRSRWLLGLGTSFTLSNTLGLKLEYQFIGDDFMDDQTLRLILQGGF